MFEGDVELAQLGTTGVPAYLGLRLSLPSERFSAISLALQRAIKIVADVVLAAILLIIISPAFLAIFICCKLDGGPALFAHRRIGKGGQPFYCLKFRTMVLKADRALLEALARDAALQLEWDTTRKLRNDPRVTWIGRVLRRTSLDEVPQLLNILCLHMSLVGPRPIVESEIPLYGSDIGYYFAARPGLTGLWQVSGRSNTTYSRRVALDAHYVATWTLKSDISVIVRTIPALLAGDGAY